MKDSHLSVRMFGELSISCGPEKAFASDGRSKAWLMVAYLVYNRQRTISREELIQLLGNGKETGDPIRMLRNARWNARRAVEEISSAVGHELIINDNGAIGWSEEVSVTLDAEEMETLCARADETQDDEERKRLLFDAIECYSGEFLHLFGDSFWVSHLAAYYQNRYLEAVRRLLPLLGSGDAMKIAEICRAALRVAPYDEELHRYLMHALTDMGDAEGAEAVYQQLRERLSEDLGIMPEHQTFAAYQRSVDRTGNRLMAPDTIQEQLREEDAEGGAMVCDYTAFRLLYRAEARSVSRRGDAIHIALLTVSGKGGKKLSQRSLKWAMNRLEAEISKTLRTGDVAASCSASQYLVMLLQANEENSRMVCDRLIRAFERDHPETTAVISATVLPLEPLQTSEEGSPRRNWNYRTK